LTQKERHASPSNMGRKKLWDESINLSLQTGTKARMDAALAEGETRLDLIREAIERELERRARAAKKATEK
jgi:hypothetical protein